MANFKKNRKWVIRAAVAFVLILGLLTFFSNTIMNATIPKVVVESAYRGNLSYTNSQTGTAKAEGVTEVKGIEGREIASVVLSNYDRVSPGDVILTLKPVTDTTALDTLEEQLLALQREAEYAARQPSTSVDYSVYLQAIVDAEAALAQANSTLSAAMNREATLTAAQGVINANSSTAIAQQAEVDAASASLEAINVEISQNQNQISVLDDRIAVFTTLGTPTPSPADPGVITPTPVAGSIEELCAQRQALVEENEILQANLADAQARLNNAASQLATTNTAIENANATIEAANSLPSVTSAQAAVNTANSALTAAREAYTNIQITTGITADQAQDSVEDRNENIAELTEQIAELSETMEATEIRATAAGYIYGMTTAVGDVLVKDQVLLQIIPDNVSCTVSFTFEESVASNFSIGMELSVDSYWIDKVVIVSIKPDASDPRNKRTVKCSIEGNVMPGEQITVVADRANSDYDCVVPSSAVYEDNSGTFIYVVEQTSTVLGDKCIVHRVKVTVEATDGARTAISGENIEGAQIVVRSEKPLHDGDRVRLTDYSTTEDERS
jgi:multidrug resistance efflux pump